MQLAADRPRPLDLRDGGRVWVRPVAQDDAAELRTTFSLLSDLSRYQRFLTGTPALSDSMVRYFTEVDHVDHEALVALPSPRSTTIVAVARYVRYDTTPTEADLALTVADRWQGRGVATGLLRLLTVRARVVGIERFTLDTLADNLAVRALIARAGGRTTSHADHTVLGEIDVRSGARDDAMRGAR